MEKKKGVQRSGGGDSERWRGVVVGGWGVHTFGCNMELNIIVEERKKAQQPAGETIVYVDQSSKKYHSKPTCSGMKNAKGIPLSQAKKKYTACKKCCKWG